MVGGTVSLTPGTSAADWVGRSVVVVGLGRAGLAAADALLERGAGVSVLDPVDSPSARQRAELLTRLDATVVPGDQSSDLPVCDLVVAGDWTPTAAVYRQAERRGLPVWSDVELARHLAPDAPARWLGLVGPGSALAANALSAILRAAGLRPTQAGGAGRPIIEVLLDAAVFDAVVLDLSPAQLHWSNQLGLAAAAVLGSAPVPPWYDQAERWPGRTTPTDPATAYQADLGKIYDQVVRACLYNVADPAGQRLVELADVVEGARAIGLTDGIPAVSMLGMVDDLLVDRAFIAQRHDSALELVALGDLGLEPGNSQAVVAYLAAAGLARAYGVPALAVRDGLRQVAGPSAGEQGEMP